MQLFYNVKLQCSTLKQFAPFSPAHSFISPFRQLLVQSPQNTAWILFTYYYSVLSYLPISLYPNLILWPIILLTPLNIQSILFPIFLFHIYLGDQILLNETAHSVSVAMLKYLVGQNHITVLTESMLNSKPGTSSITWLINYQVWTFLVINQENRSPQMSMFQSYHQPMYLLTCVHTYELLTSLQH